MDKGIYTIDLDDQARLVRVVAQGILDKDLGEEIISTARTAATEQGYDILYDVRDTIARVSLADWFYLPRRLGIFKRRGMRRIRAAVLISAGEQEQAYRFYQTVTSNLGFNVRIFTSQDAALEWLRPGAHP